MIKKLEPCPCGSNKTFGNCCQSIIANDSASSAEQLMRSRYTAFVLGDAKYLLQTWHPDTCPHNFQLGQSRWLRLTIHHADTNTVSFSAAFHSGNKGMLLEETSRFVCMDGHWRYLDGDCTVNPIKRNALCFCGSDIKYKNCCGKRSTSEA
ncbi:MAG: YchJ family metal-binding protein [Mariprofundaceae bacterium]|nr:YchJ family metal-binding protein [Mariprofundaceae bacterium]